MNIYESIILKIACDLGWNVRSTKSGVRINGMFFISFPAQERFSNPYNHAPKSYTHSYWNSHRSREKQAIFRELSGKEPHYPYNHRKSKTWEYW
jgi:hypothetical protein